MVFTRKLSASQKRTLPAMLLFLNLLIGGSIVVSFFKLGVIPLIYYGIVSILLNVIILKFFSSFIMNLEKHEIILTPESLTFGTTEVKLKQVTHIIINTFSKQSYSGLDRVSGWDRGIFFYESQKKDVNTILNDNNRFSDPHFFKNMKLKGSLVTSDVGGDGENTFYEILDFVTKKHSNIEIIGKREELHIINQGYEFIYYFLSVVLLFFYGISFLFTL